MMIILMMSMMLGTGFVREVPHWLQWARSVSVMGIVSDLGMYLEYRDIPVKYGTPDEIFDQYGVKIRSDDELWSSVLILFWIWLVARFICYLFVKFCFTGRTLAEDFKD